MRSSHVLSVVCLALAALTLAASASADDLIETSAGVKLAGGGNLLTAPSDIPMSADVRGFRGGGGGIGYGIGLYGELRLVKILGLETGITYDNSNVWRNVTITVGNVAIETKEKFAVSSLRIPVLAKGIVPLGFGRASLGIGPEFIVPLSASGSLEATSGSAQLAGTTLSRTASSIMLATDLGMVIALGLIEIPIDLRVSKNLKQPNAWADRVSYDPGGQSYTVQAQSSWDFRLVAGIGVSF
jgi:hypothetical protein